MQFWSKIISMEEVLNYYRIRSPVSIKGIFEEDHLQNRCFKVRKIIRYRIVKVNWIVKLQIVQILDSHKIKNKDKK